MKFKSVILLAAAMLLTGCDIIDVTRDSHKPGLEGSAESKTTMITYFDGDQIDKTNLVAHELTFIADEEEIVISKENPNDLKAFIIDSDNVLDNVDKAEEISTFYHFEENGRLGDGIKVGYSSDLVDGVLNLSFNCTIRAAEVYGYLRYGLKGFEEGNKIVVDQNAAISANGSRYIKLPYQEEAGNLEQKVCSYNFANEQNLLKLTVYGKRAVFTKIIVYS